MASYNMFLVCLLILVLGKELQAYPSTNLDIKNTNFIESLKNYRNITEIPNLLKNYSNEPGSITAQVNRVADIVLEEIDKMIVAAGLDSVPMPGFMFDFIVRIGTEDGKFLGIGSLKRFGDAFLTYKYPNLILRSQLSFDKMAFVYKYEATIFGIGVKGSIEGASTGSYFLVENEFDLTTLQWKRADFHLIAVGDVTFKFKENFFDDIINLINAPLVNIITPILKDVVTQLIRGTLNFGRDFYNKVICDYLDSCTF